MSVSTVVRAPRKFLHCLTLEVQRASRPNTPRKHTLKEIITLIDYTFSSSSLTQHLQNIILHLLYQTNTTKTTSFYLQIIDSLLDKVIIHCCGSEWVSKILRLGGSDNHNGSYYNDNSKTLLRLWFLGFSESTPPCLPSLASLIH